MVAAVLTEKWFKPMESRLKSMVTKTEVSRKNIRQLLYKMYGVQQVTTPPYNL